MGRDKMTVKKSFFLAEIEKISRYALPNVDSLSNQITPDKIEDKMGLNK
jgi:hypothetical protein